MTTLAEIDLDPGIRSWIARIEEIAPTMPGLVSRDPVVLRAAALELSDRLAVEFTLPVPDGVEIDDAVVDGPGGELRIRRYRAAGADGPVPSVLWLHGGGFYAGSTHEILNDRLLARRTLDSGVQHLSVDYRLAPEHPYPAQVDDAIAALAAVAADPVRFGVDPARLGIGGNSAGAAIAASTSLRLRDEGGPHLHHVDLEVPPTALRPVGDSASDFAVGFGLDEMALIASMYVGPDGPADGYASALDVADLAGLPPHLIMVAEYDPLRDSGVQYAERLRAAGVGAELYVGAGQLHGSPGQTAASPGAAAWQREHSRLLAIAYDTH
jgi:acetyl esterase